MQMIYNSEQFVVVGFDLSAPPPGPATEGTTAVTTEVAAGVATETGQAQVLPAPPARGGYEIVDKRKGREIFIEGAVARSFQLGVQALVEQGPDEAALDEYISSYTQLAQQPVHLH